jgi:GDP-L-fucose synthase
VSDWLNSLLKTNPLIRSVKSAVLFLMLNYNEEVIINVGTGEDLTIAELCGIVRDVVGFKGEIGYDTSMPDGTPRKVVDVGRLSKLGWSPKITLRSGIEQTYFFMKTSRNIRSLVQKLKIKTVSDNSSSCSQNTISR